MEKVADTYKILLKRFRTRENGPVVDSMKRMGLNYKRSFGVSLIDMKSFAEEYRGNQELALFLWEKDFRETKILSLMIADAEKLSEEQIQQYISGIDNIELAEQAAMHVLSKLPENLKYAYQWCKSTATYTQVTGLLVLSRLVLVNKELKDEDLLPFFELFHEIGKKNNFHIKKALGRALLQMGKRNSLKQKVIDFIKDIENENTETASWLKEEVVYFLEN